MGTTHQGTRCVRQYEQRSRSARPRQIHPTPPGSNSRSSERAKIRANPFIAIAIFKAGRARYVKFAKNANRGRLVEHFVETYPPVVASMATLS